MKGKHNERCISSGRIVKIKNYKFYHDLDTIFGSSGSPLINKRGYVVGIHTSGYPEYKINEGTFIRKILDNLKYHNNFNNKFINIGDNAKRSFIVETKPPAVQIPQNPYQNVPVTLSPPSTPSYPNQNQIVPVTLLPPSTLSYPNQNQIVPVTLPPSTPYYPNYNNLIIIGTQPSIGGQISYPSPMIPSMNSPIYQINNFQNIEIRF